MKTKLILAGSAVVVITVVGVWAGRAVWARRHGLVSLGVRNAPLGEVIRTLERQTGEKIALDRKLDGLVTLKVSRKPLPNVLDRIAQQCGASWRTVHAVYESSAALGQLESSLYGDRTLDEVGWKMIAPAGFIGGPINVPGGKRVILTNSGPAGGLAEFGGGSGGPVRVMVRRSGQGEPQVVTDTGGGPLPAGALVETEDAVAETGTNGASGSAVKMRKQQSPAIMRVVRKKSGGSGGDSIEEEVWTPIEIVLEARLSEQLLDFSGEPTFEAAREAAKKVKGQVKTYYALRKSPLGMGMANMSFNLGHEGGGRVVGKGGPGLGGAGGTNVTKMMGAIPSTGELEAAMAQRRSDELGKLTPEQRVLRARERMQSSQNH